MKEEFSVRPSRPPVSQLRLELRPLSCSQGCSLGSFSMQLGRLVFPEAPAAPTPAFSLQRPCNCGYACITVGIKRTCLIEKETLFLKHENTLKLLSMIKVKKSIKKQLSPEW